MQQDIQDRLLKAARALGAEKPSASLDFPEDLAHGDLSSNIALVIAKELNESPRTVAEKIVSHLGDMPGVLHIAIAGPGFINFFLSAESVRATLGSATNVLHTWGEGAALSGKSVMIEHTQPNPFKVFHIGHLMSNTIGESLVRLTENQGARVVRANYQGDVGLHVAKALWGMQELAVDPEDIHALGRAYAHGAKAYEEDERAKAAIDEVNKKAYEKTDATINDLYEAGRATSLAAFEKIYALLGSSFDRYYFESETGPIGQAVVEKNPNVFPESEGARVFKGEEYGLHTRVFVTAKGFPTYEAKELGLEILKEKEYPECDSFIVTTAVEQQGVFEVIKKALEQVAPDVAKKLVHVAHGMMRLPSGKMSSRTGDVITGESLIAALIESATARAKESRAEDPQKLAEAVAVAAIKFQILRQSTGKDIVFDEARALSIEGDSGPYIQYAHARCVSILEKARAAGVSGLFDEAQTPLDIERMLVRFPVVCERAALERAPHHLATFLIQISGAFNAWYAQEQILDGTDLARHKVAVVATVARTLEKGLYLLGITAPEAM